MAIKKKPKAQKWQLLGAYKSARNRRRKVLPNLIYVADKWTQHSDIVIGTYLKKKPSTIAKYRYVLGINRATYTADQSKIDAIRQEYAQLIDDDKKIEDGRLKARRTSTKELTSKIKEVEKTFQDLQKRGRKTVLKRKYIEDLRDIYNELIQLRAKRALAQDQASHKYDRKVQAELLEQLGYKS